jgi:hypothetical protein
VENYAGIVPKRLRDLNGESAIAFPIADAVDGVQHEVFEGAPRVQLAASVAR